ncbi:hypothetical protein Golob_021143 [Gossypium lobatum]|uniref:Aminotransferase-like plant mobile domain-containing protein n=1 Tax=Gossypium lobatum TaxID=34289 RepID=A0A7J8LCK4_9ROSI|nr:hypothetical protein [Gossypium lobatum]
MEGSSNSIVEERAELMVSPDNKNLELRTAHFITPSIGLTSIDGNLPNHCLSSLTKTYSKNRAMEVNFVGWRHPQKEWKAWVANMASLHESTWKEAGIFEAIMNSTYKIERNNDLVFGVAEKWCHETNSFIFPWGEATITLEDIMILGGYSVLGSPVFTPVETEEMEETWEKLENARKEMYKSTTKKASHSLWIRMFMHSGSEIEHEAFLALWLSRFVLPSCFDVVANIVFPIAIHLARGTRIALGPAALAKIYSDLSCLKQNIIASTQLDSKCDGGNVAVALEVTLCSQLTLVQVWVWERFPDLRPKPNLIENGDPRLALWHDLKCKVQDVRSVLDSSKERFDWRPYVNCGKFYGDTAIWISVDLSLDDELLSFAQCLRASELVGLECIEQYLPHRVALQFGMDQDIPCSVPRSNDSPEIAWSNYNNSVGGGKLYIPSKLFKGDVTAKYSNWWKQSVLILQEESIDVLLKQRSSTNFKMTPNGTMGINGTDMFKGLKLIPKCMKRPREDYTYSGFKTMPKKFKGVGTHTSSLTRPGSSASSDHGSPMIKFKQLPKYPERKKEVCNAGFVARSLSIAIGSEVDTEVKNESTSSSSLSKLKPDFVIQKELNNFSFPPGFPPKGNMLQAKGSFNRDKVTVAVPVPPGFIPKSSITEDKINPPFPAGFPSKCNMMEVRDIVDARDFVEDKVTVTMGGNHSASHLGSLSLDSDDEDQLTISQMSKPYKKFGNIDRRDALENSSGHCSAADNVLPRCELITTLGAEEDAHGASIVPAIYCNACPNEQSWLHLEARISKLETLLGKMKAARQVKSLVTKGWVNLD